MMAEEIPSTMNLDLNLSPDPELGLETEVNSAAVELSDWANGPGRETESLRRFRSRHRSRFSQIDIRPVLAETHSREIDWGELLITSVNGSALPAGERSIAGGERVGKDSKKCENGSKVIEEDNVTEKKDVEKIIGSDGSFFDCYVCLDLSKDPVVTNCGHLFCWACLYRWLQVSEAKECPVCKGEVSVKTLTPIYGRGKHKRESEEVSDTKIPSRPQARRIESLRTTLNRSRFMSTDLISRHLQDRVETESSTGQPAPYLTRFMTSRGVRAEQNQSSETLVAPSDDINDSDLISNTSPEHEEENGNRGRSSRVLSIRRQLQAPRTGRMSPLTLSSAERLMDAYLITHALGRNQEQNNNPPIGVEDRDSFSSIVGVITSESPVDTAAEIDSMLTVSTSSSVRRHANNSRVNDADSADSRPLRRRRLT